MFAQTFVTLLAVVIGTVFAINKNLYDFKINDITGQPVSLKKYRGKTLLIVNTASQCGYTDSHFFDLTRLHGILTGGGSSFEILAFPCNDFGGQESWEPDQINTFLRSNYKATFPLMQKVDILGENPHPIWQHIIDVSGITPTWNFHKYLFDSKGQFIQAWDATVGVEYIFDDITRQAALDSSSTGNRPEL